MPNIGKTMLDGAILSVLASLFLIAVLRFNPRLFLQDYPEDIQKQVPPKTGKEKRQSLTTAPNKGFHPTPLARLVSGGHTRFVVGLVLKVVSAQSRRG